MYVKFKNKEISVIMFAIWILVQNQECLTMIKANSNILSTEKWTVAYKNILFEISNVDLILSRYFWLINSSFLGNNKKISFNFAWNRQVFFSEILLFFYILV